MQGHKSIRWEPITVLQSRRCRLPRNVRAAIGAGCPTAAAALASAIIAAEPFTATTIALAAAAVAELATAAAVHSSCIAAPLCAV